MAALFKITVNTKQLREVFTKLEKRIAQIPKRVLAVPPRPWELVNSYLEEAMLERFQAKRDGFPGGLSENTKAWKRTHVGVLRPVAGQLRLPLLAQNVNVYGQATGYSDRQLFTHQAVGSFTTREVRSLIPASGLVGTALRFGIRLAGYDRGYPLSILKPASTAVHDIVSAEGGPGGNALVHLTQADIKIAAHNIFDFHIKPTLDKIFGGGR